MGFVVLNGGFMSTIQDMGRLDFQHCGVPQSGMLDRLSGRIANILVDNPPDTPVLEMMAMGAELKFTEANTLAVTGGEVTPYLNGEEIPAYSAFTVKSGDILHFSSIRNGSVIYLAFAGGLDLPKVLGSCSTYLRGELGGLHGGRLKVGDELQFSSPNSSLSNMQARGEFPLCCGDEVKSLGVVLGAQRSAFTDEGIETFFSSTYTITQEFDRMGCRLEGNTIEHLKDANVISDGIVYGAIQIPGHGMPIIMLADRQTVGGYTKIGAVCSADLPNFVQSQPGQKITFYPIEVGEAEEKYRKMMGQLTALHRRIQQGIPFWHTRINGKSYDVLVEEIPL